MRVRELELTLRKQENRNEYEHVSVQSIIEIYLTDTTHRPYGGLSYTISTPPLLLRHRKGFMMPQVVLVLGNSTG